MSSSTMIQGAATRRAMRNRTTAETTTRPASHAQTGTARTSERAGAPTAAALSAKPDLARGGGESPGVLDPDLARRLSDVLEQHVADTRAAGPLLECGDVEVGHVSELVLVHRVSGHRLASLGIGEEEERSGERLDLALVGLHLQHPVGQLGERVDVADDERLREREDADDPRD